MLHRIVMDRDQVVMNNERIMHGVVQAIDTTRTDNGSGHSNRADMEERRTKKRRWECADGQEVQ